MCGGNTEASLGFGDNDRVGEPELDVDGVGGGGTVPVW